MREYFTRLLGNGDTRLRLGRAIENGTLSHAFLISGPEGTGKTVLATELAAAINCENRDAASRPLPCGICNSCRRIREGKFTDLTFVARRKDKATLGVDVIKELREDMFLSATESEHKVYVIDEAEYMTVEAQNALLKVLEEPPKYGVFILLTDNPERLLPTVRSRCTELQLRPVDAGILRKALAREFPQASDGDISAAIARSGGFLGQAKKMLAEGDSILPQTESFVKSFVARDSLQLTQTLVPMEKWKRDQLIPVLQQWLELLEGGLACRSGMAVPNPLARSVGSQRSPRELMDAIGHLKKAIEYAQSNVSPAAICGYLAWELR